MNAPAVVNPAFDAIPLEQLVPSPTNPRKHFDAAALEDLAASVGKQGVLQPLLVRPLSGFDDKFEIVCGERRWRASKAAALPLVPCLVRTLSDAEVLEIQVVENLQRQDLHPMEEAEGYEALMKQHLYAVEDIAGKVGKSKAYVYARLKLLALTADARKWFASGKLTASTALLVARIPTPSLQKKAAELIGDPKWQSEPLGFRAASELVQREFMLQLKDAPFPTDDATLVVGAGSCTTCPRRTGNNPDLFEDVKSGDTCTDPGCFKAKRETWVDRQLKEAEAAGATVLKGKDAKAVLPNAYSAPQRGYVDLDSVVHSIDSSKPLRKVLGRGVTPTAVMEHPHRTGQIVELISTEVLTEALKAKGIEPGAKPAGSFAAQEDPAWLKRQAERTIDDATDRRLFELAVAKNSGEFGRTELLCLVDFLLCDWFDSERLLAAHGLLDDQGAGLDAEKFDGLLKKASVFQLERLVIHVMLDALLERDEEAPARVRYLEPMLKRLRIDPKKVRAEVVRALKAEEKAKTKPVTTEKPAAAAKSKPAKKKAAKR